MENNAIINLMESLNFELYAYGKELKDNADTYRFESFDEYKTVFIKYYNDFSVYEVQCTESYSDNFNYCFTETTVARVEHKLTDWLYMMEIPRKYKLMALMEDDGFFLTEWHRELFVFDNKLHNYIEFVFINDFNARTITFDINDDEYRINENIAGDLPNDYDELKQRINEELN